MKTKTRQELIEEHAERIGEAPERVGVTRLNVLKMRELGTLVDIDVIGTTMFTKKASWSDLGIPAQDVRASRFTRGSKHIVPVEYVKRLQSFNMRFRALLDKHSFNVTGFQPYRWVPYTAYFAWREKHQELVDELEAFKRQIVEELPDIEARLVDDFTAIANEAWDAMMARKREGDTIILESGVEVTSREQYVDLVVSKVKALLPTAEAIMGGIQVTYRNNLMISQSELEAEAARVAAAEAQRAAEYAKIARAQEEINTELRIAREREAAELRLIREQEAAERRLISAEAEKAELELKEREVKLAAMRQAELEHAREQVAAMRSPFEEVFHALRAQIHQDVSEIAAIIAKHGVLPPRTASRAKNLIETFSLLNAHEDDELEQALEELRAKVETRNDTPAPVSDPDNVAGVVDQLEHIKEMLHESAQEIARERTRAAALMI